MTEFDNNLTTFEERVLAPMRERFVGKAEIIDLIAITAISQENLLILGPPGTAKSDLIATFALHVHGRYFQYLLTKFTEPNEIFGPIDLNRLREGVVITNIEGMLPDAEFAFLDEIFNANSAILNSLLTILNERTFRRGKERHTLDLFAVFGATNALPEDESLRALFDRFLLRVRSNNVEATQLPSLFELGWSLERARIEGNRSAHTDTGYSTQALRELSRALTTIDLNGIRDQYLGLMARIRAAGIEITDRRLVKLLRAVAAAALLRRKTAATPADLWVLRYIWSNEDEAVVLEEIVQSAIDEYLKANPAERAHRLARPSRPYELKDILEEFNSVRALALPDTIRSAIDGDLLLERLDTLTRKLEWLTPATETERNEHQQLLKEIRALAAEIEATAARF